MRLTTILLFFCVIVVAIWRMVPGLDNHPFFMDEHEFVRKSYFYNLYFVKHDFVDPRWYDATLENGAMQPKVGPYIFGAVYQLLGYTDIEKTFAETGFNTIQVDGRPWYQALWLKAPNTFPAELKDSMKLIFIARRVAMVFTVASVALLFILCTTLVSPLFAYATSILMIANPLFNREGKFAMTDTMQLFFLFLGLFLLVLWQRAWVQNARAAGEVTLTKNAKTEAFSVVELKPQESAPVLKKYLALAPITQPYFDARPGSPEDSFFAEASRHPVFELQTLK